MLAGWRWLDAIGFYQGNNLCSMPVYTFQFLDPYERTSEDTTHVACRRADGQTDRHFSTLKCCSVKLLSISANMLFIMSSSQNKIVLPKKQQHIKIRSPCHEQIIFFRTRLHIDRRQSNKTVVEFNWDIKIYNTYPSVHLQCIRYNWEAHSIYHFIL